MTTQTARAATEVEQRMVLPAQTDPIRIVPLHLPDEATQPLVGAPPAVAPKLTYRGGPLLTAVKVVGVYWGSYWQQPPGSDMRTALDKFFDDILVSPLLDQMGEYSTAGKTIAHGSRHRQRHRHVAATGAGAH